MNSLDENISVLSKKYLPLAEELLKEAIRIPADYVDKPVDQGGDPECGLSNHEGPRLKYLKKRITELAPYVVRKMSGLMNMEILSGQSKTLMTEFQMKKNE